MVDIITPNMNLQKRPRFVGKREVSAFVEGPEGRTEETTPKFQVEFAEDPMGVIYLCMLQQIEDLQAEIKELKTKIKED